MVIIYKSADELIEADYNPRKISDKDFEQLKKSLGKFDCVEPIIINTFEGRENIIVGGHQRLKAMKSLNFEQIPCIEVCLDLEKEKELNVRLNKNTGEFDLNKLVDEFDIDSLVLFGFDENLLNSMSFNFDNEPEFKDPETEKESITISFLITDRKDVETELNRIVGKFINCAWM